MAERAANGEGSAGIQWKFAGYTADAVSSEEFTHEEDFFRHSLHGSRRGGSGNLRDGLASHGEPQQHGQRQGGEFEPEVVQQVPAQEVHGQGPTSGFMLRAGPALDGEAIGVGRAAGGR